VTDSGKNEKPKLSATRFFDAVLLSLRFKQKGILLVALPLAFEIFFVVLLSMSYLNAEAESRRAEHGRRILTITDAMTSSAFAIGAALFVSPGANPEEFQNRFLTMEQNLQALVESLVRETKPYAKEAKLAGDIGLVLQDLQSQAKSMREMALDPLQMIAKSSFRKSRLQAKKSLHNLATSIDALISYEESVSGARLRRAQRARQQLNILLYAGVAANVALSIWTAILFASQITNRLAVVSRNATSMSKKHYPEEEVGGKDELAELDKLIHNLSGMLIESSKRELALVDNTAEVIVSLSESHKITAVNAAAVKQWGWEPDALISTNFVQLVLAEHRQAFLNSLDAVRRAPGEHSFECSMLRRDGSISEVRWSVLWSEREQSFFAIIRDVGEERRLEKLQKQFYAMVTHDLRTPLANIKLFLDMLRNGAYGELTKAGVDRIGKLDGSVDFLTSLTNDLLELSRMQTKNLILKPEPFDPAALVLECCSMLEVLFQSRQIKLDVQVKSEEAMIADFLRLKQVLANFLSNAIKFSPEGGTVKITIAKRDNFRRVVVQDEGHNLTNEDCKQIFEPYVQAKNQKAGQMKGFGLGLAVAKTIIDSHFGHIGAEVNEEGTSFWFEVPDAPQPIEESDSDAKPLVDSGTVSENNSAQLA